MICHRKLIRFNGPIKSKWDWKPLNLLWSSHERGKRQRIESSRGSRKFRSPLSDETRSRISFQSSSEANFILHFYIFYGVENVHVCRCRLHFLLLSQRFVHFSSVKKFLTKMTRFSFTIHHPRGLRRRRYLHSLLKVDETCFRASWSTANPSANICHSWRCSVESQKSLKFQKSQETFAHPKSVKRMRWRIQIFFAHPPQPSTR